jgi:arylamine N-acetyltransferase
VNTAAHNALPSRCIIQAVTSWAKFTTKKCTRQINWRGQYQERVIFAKGVNEWTSTHRLQISHWLHSYYEPRIFYRLILTAVLCNTLETLSIQHYHEFRRTKSQSTVYIYRVTYMSKRDVWFEEVWDRRKLFERYYSLAPEYTPSASDMTAFCCYGNRRFINVTIKSHQWVLSQATFNYIQLFTN